MSEISNYEAQKKKLQGLCVSTTSRSASSRTAIPSRW